MELEVRGLASQLSSKNADEEVSLIQYESHDEGDALTGIVRIDIESKF